MADTLSRWPQSYKFHQSACIYLNVFLKQLLQKQGSTELTSACRIQGSCKLLPCHIQVSPFRLRMTKGFRRVRQWNSKESLALGTQKKTGKGKQPLGFVCKRTSIIPQRTTFSLVLPGVSAEHRVLPGSPSPWLSLSQVVFAHPLHSYPPSSPLCHTGQSCCSLTSDLICLCPWSDLLNLLIQSVRKNKLSAMNSDFSRRGWLQGPLSASEISCERFCCELFSQ